jgi:hypothetical protein
MSTFEKAVRDVVRRYLDGELTPEEAINEIVIEASDNSVDSLTRNSNG